MILYSINNLEKQNKHDILLSIGSLQVNSKAIETEKKSPQGHPQKENILDFYLGQTL